MLKKFFSMVLVVAMVLSLAVTTSYASLEGTATLKITPSKTEETAGEDPITVVYTIELIAPVGKEVGAFAFNLKAPENVTLATTKLANGKTNMGKATGYWYNYIDYKYRESDDGDILGVFNTFEYTPASGYFAAAGVGDEASKVSGTITLMTIAATIEAGKAGSFALEAENLEVCFDGEAGNNYAVTVDSTPIVITSSTPACEHAAKTHTDAVAKGCLTVGNIEYWYCPTCEKYFSDEACNTEIAQADTVLAAYGSHDFSVAQYNDTQHWNKCSRCDATDTKIDHSGATDWQHNDTHHWKVCGCGAMVQEAAHTWNSGVETIPATCETDGVKTYTCTVCSATKTETITKLGHSYTSYTVSSPASCTANAQETATCDHAGCGKTDTREVANSKLPHNFIAERASSEYLADAATCQHPATYFYSCATCGENENDNQHTFASGEKASHNYNVLQSDSLKHWYKCASCSDITGEVSHFGGEATCKDLAVCEICHQPYGTVDESKHTGGTANCVDKAICDVCHQPYGSVDPTNHKSLNTVGQLAATCTADGATGVGHCDACEQDIGTSQTIEALGHQYGDPTYTWSDNYSSCTATFTCTREGCTDAQKDHAVTVDCNVTSEITTPATCTAKGVETFTATVTFEGKPYTDTKPVDVDMIDHELENVTGTPATCETAGVMDHFKCKKCDKLFVEKEDSQLLEEVENVTIPAKNHNWVEDEVITLPTCTEKGESSYICLNDRSHTKTEAVDALGHKWDAGKVTKEATCEAKGEMLYTCQNDPTHTKIEEIPALGHKFGTDGKCTICGVADPNFKPADNTPTTNNTPADPTKPATGDAGVGVWVALLSVSALLGTAIVVKKRHA